MASEVGSIVRCHEALNDKSEGKSEKLSMSTATPIMIPAGKNLYFVTETSILVLKNTFLNKDVIIRIDEKQSPVFSKINFGKDGSFGGISFQDLTAAEKQSAVTPRAQLDEESLNVVKKELIKRMNSVTGEYQNKYDPQATIDALNVCSEVKSPELQKSLAKQLPFYEARLKKNGGYKKPAVKSSN